MCPEPKPALWSTTCASCMTLVTLIVGNTLTACLGVIGDIDCGSEGLCNPPNHPQQYDGGFPSDGDASTAEDGDAYSDLDPGDHNPPECTPFEEEEQDCGACGVTTRVCDSNGFYGDWSACVDPAPDRNPNDEPTWDNRIDDIMVRRCNDCHSQTQTYQGLQFWLTDGSLEQKTQQGHHVSGNDRDVLLRWIEIDAPETDCDVD
ncbi:hypothetical protein ACFL6C_11980 [Myxococcota bacterium]